MKSNIAKSHWILSTLVSLGALFITATASAAEFCVTTSDELKDALSEAATNGEHDTIKIAAGIYTPGSGFFSYNSHIQGGDDRSLTLEGGWTESEGNPCGQLSAEAPNLTVLDAERGKRVMSLAIRENSNLTVRLLTFKNGYVVNLNNGGGLGVYVSGDYTGRIFIERNLFWDNEAYRSGGLYIPEFNAVGNARVGIVNNTFIGNHARVTNPAGSIYMKGGDGGALGAGIYMTNNTVLNNTIEVSGFTPWGGFNVSGNTPNLYVINNNMWGNEYVDLAVNLSFPPPPVNQVYRLLNNNIGMLHPTGSVPTHDFGNISVEPEYIPCFAICVPWVPTVNSPLVDAGTHSGNFSPFWTMPALDAAGNLRVAEGTVDIGAYENHDRFFSDRFEPSN